MNSIQPKTENAPSPVARFVRALERLERDDTGAQRATMASLRCGLRQRDGIALEMMPFVAEFLPAHETKRDRYFFQIAALFALHPQSTRAGSFASTFRKLADDGSDSIEKRFQLLLAARSDELFGPLSQCVSLLKAAPLPINWKRLLDDLYFGDWDSPGRELQLKWAREFYRKAHPVSPSSTTPTQPENAHV